MADVPDRTQSWAGSPLDAVLADYLKQLEAGQVPDRSAIIAAHPDLADELRQFFADQDAFDVQAQHVPIELSVTGALPVRPRPMHVRYIGDYEVLDEVARGGMGVVYKAKQRSVGRMVALKMMLSGAHASDSEKRRFQAEVEAAANLDHPNIVPIHEVGEHEGQPYFAMRFLEGPTLKQVARGTPKDEARRLIKIASAVHFAHQRGILHRDLKPGNILTDGAGEPYVTDFGLARRIDADESMTQTGAVLGTPAYMAPEQATGAKGISIAADIYSLGVILFERLTGSLPFRAETQHALLRQVQEQEPPRPSSIVPGLPRDLETICLKCLRKSPGQRYATVADLRDDLERWLTGKPIHARPVGPVERTLKWLRRNSLVSSATAAVFLAMAAGTIISYAKYRDAEEARKAESERVRERDARAQERDQALAAVLDREKKLEASSADLKYTLGNTHMMLANVAYDNNDVVLAQDYLDKVPVEQRKFEWHYRQKLVRGGLFTLYGHTGPVTSVAYSPDGKRIVTGSGDGTARVWDARTGQIVLELKGHSEGVTSVSFSPDGMRIATGSWDKTAKVWDSRTGQNLIDLMGHKDRVTSVSFSPDGTRIATGSCDETAKMWDTRTGRCLRSLKGMGQRLSRVIFSPDGNKLAAGDDNGTAWVWDAQTARMLQEWPWLGDGVRSISFSPDGTKLAIGSGGSRKMARVLDALTGASLLQLKGHIRIVSSISFSPDGARLLTGGDDHTARVWDATTGEILAELKGHTGWVTGASFSPDGNRIVTCSEDGTAKAWDATSGHGLLELNEEVIVGLRASISPDGTRLVTTGDRDTAQVWDAKTGASVLELTGHIGWVMGASFSPDSTRLVTGSEDNTARVWDVKTGKSLVQLRGHELGVLSVSFSPDGSQVATGSADRTAKVWDAKTGRCLLELKGHTEGVLSLSFSTDGARLATGSEDLTTKVWDAKTGQVLLDLKVHDYAVTSVSFSPDGARIATGGQDGIVNVCDARTGETLLELKGHSNGVSSISFSPDGSRLVTGSLDRTVRVWDVQNGQALLELRGHSDSVTSVSFSHDGMRIVTGSRKVRVWDAQNGQRLLELKGHTRSVTSASFSPNGTRIVTGSWDKTAKVWEVQYGRKLLDLQGHTGGVTSVSFSPDGTRIVTGSIDHSSKVWDAQNGQNLLDLKGHTDVVTSVSFSPDGTRIVTRAHDKTEKVWDATTGAELKGEQTPKSTIAGKSSHDGLIFPHRQANLVLLVPTLQSFRDLEYRRFWTRPRLDRHLAERAIAEKSGNRLSEAFHLDRVLAYSANRDELQKWLAYRHDRLLGKPHVSARAIVHSAEAFGADTQPLRQIERMKLLALQGDREAWRCLAGLLIRTGKSGEAIGPLKVALTMRERERPPVEELLLALAYAKQGNHDEAKVWHKRAVDWLDLHQRPMQIASALGTTMTDGWAGMGELVRRQSDPRYNTFDWESWYECEVFRAEVEALLAKIRNAES